MGSYYKILVIPQSACLSPSAGPSVAGCSPVADRCCTFRRKAELEGGLGFLTATGVLPLPRCVSACALPNDTDDGEDWSTSLVLPPRRMCSVGQLSFAPACVSPGQVGLLKITSKL